MTNKLTAAQVEQLARDAGADKLRAKLMVAIAYAESGFDADAVNRNTNGTTDVGLWQINSVHRQANPTWTTEWLKVPANNASAAWSLSQKGKTWQPWDASKENWWPAAKKAIAGEFSGDNPLLPNVIEGPLDKAGEAAGAVIDGAQATAEALGNVVQIAGKTGAWLGNPHNWLRIAYVGLGAGVVVVGLAKLIGYDAGLSPAGAVKSLKSGAASASGKVSEARITRARGGAPNQTGEVLARGGHS